MYCGIIKIHGGSVSLDFGGASTTNLYLQWIMKNSLLFIIHKCKSMKLHANKHLKD